MDCCLLGRHRIIRPEGKSRTCWPIHVLLAVWVVLGTNLPSARAATAADSDRLERIAAELDDLNKQWTPIWVHYTVSERDSPEWIARQTHRPADDRGKTTLGELRWDTTVEWAQKGDLVRSTFSGPFVASGTTGRDRALAHVYDGSKSILFDGELSQGQVALPIYKVSRDPKRVCQYQANPHDVAGISRLWIALESWRLTKDAFAVIVRDEGGANGQPQTYVETGLAKNARGPLMKAWLLPDRRFLPARVETYSEKGELLVESADVEYQQVDGVLYPLRAVSRDMSKGGATIRERTLQVKSVRFRATEIPDSLFQLDIPANSVVFDLDNNRWVRDPSRIDDLH